SAGCRQATRRGSREPLLDFPAPAGRASLRDAFRRPCPRYAPARLALPALPGLSPLPAAHAGATGAVSALYAGTYAAVSDTFYSAIALLVLLLVLVVVLEFMQVLVKVMMLEFMSRLSDLFYAKLNSLDAISIRIHEYSPESSAKRPPPADIE
ncbi:hypothetical protein, partial [Acerihabitans sp.]|uniref:hypothetical protein n=1 Tax=Acerihabitans sp. TaxID=2811394 RepID=UPI002EDB1E0D